MMHKVNRSHLPTNIKKSSLAIVGMILFLNFGLQKILIMAQNFIMVNMDQVTGC